MRVRLGLLSALVLLVATCGGCGPAGRDDSVTITAGKYSAINFEAIIEQAKAKVFPTLVYVRPIREDYSEGKKRRMVVGGSGVIISADGYVVTNHHVAEKAVEIRCVLHDNSMLRAELIGTDQDTDLALLKLIPEDPATVFPHAELADSEKVEEGQFVMALGAPWGLKRSISLGVVASAQRYLEGASQYSLWIQSDASLNPGNSGGPLINTEGQIVGINTMGSLYGGDLGFSVPSSTVAYVVDQLRRNKEVKRSWTGLRLQPLRDFERDSFFEGDRGVLVASVDPGSPAEQAAFRPGDLILSVGGQETNGLYNEDLPKMRDLLGRLPADQPVAVEVRRDGRAERLTITVREKGSVEGRDLDLKRWNMTVKAVNEHYDPDLFYYVREGVYVQAVQRPGNAQEADFNSRMVMVEVDGKPVKTLEDIKTVYEQVMADTERKKQVLFKVMEQGVPSLLVLDYARDYDKE